MVRLSKNVLIISGIPRKNGNSDLVCDQFSLGVQAAGHTVEKVFLQDKQVNYCIACDVCRNSGGACIHQDDMADILEKMIAQRKDFVLSTDPNLAKNSYKLEIDKLRNNGYIIPDKPGVDGLYHVTRGGN